MMDRVVAVARLVLIAKIACTLQWLGYCRWEHGALMTGMIPLHSEGQGRSLWTFYSLDLEQVHFEAQTGQMLCLEKKTRMMYVVL